MSDREARAVVEFADQFSNPVIVARDPHVATSENALTANEIAETCDLPRSTAYRKLNLLTEAGLLEERTRIRRSGKHASEYARSVEDVVISLDSQGAREIGITTRGRRTDRITDPDKW